MKFSKALKDQCHKILLGKYSVPRGLFESQKYFRTYGEINFKIEKIDNIYIAKSRDFKLGTIITEAPTKKELDNAIVDAILTSFEIPNSYKTEANIRNKATEKKEYAFA